MCSASAGYESFRNFRVWIRDCGEKAWMEITKRISDDESSGESTGQLELSAINWEERPTDLILQEPVEKVS